MLSRKTSKFSLSIAVIICVTCVVRCQSEKNFGHQSPVPEIDENCVNLQTHNFTYIGELTCCHLNSQSSFLNRSFSDVREFKDENFAKTNISSNEIGAISISRIESLSILPTGINESFPAVKALVVKMTGLKTLNAEDIEQFSPNLTWVDFSQNKLTELQGDLFNSTKNLVYINLSYNPITCINPQLFESFNLMKELQEVKIVLSTCISRKYQKNRGVELQTFKWYANSCNKTCTVTNKIEVIVMNNTEKSSVITYELF